MPTLPRTPPGSSPDLRLIAVGRLRAGPEAALFERYAARLRPKLLTTELTDAPGAPIEAKRREGAAILAAIPDNAWVVALDLGGQATDSLGFAALLQRWQALGRPLCFLIGGTEGLDATVLARADTTLSLGRLTWPHLLARVLFVEQLYRAQCIIIGHPYHRAGRPRGSAP